MSGGNKLGKIKLMGSKKGIEFSFTWLFAVIIGAVIIVLAIYAATKLIGTGGTEAGTAAAKEIGVLLNPLETGFEEGKTSAIEISSETKIYNSCDDSGDFGSQGIQTSQQSFGKWSELSALVSFEDKYIFSSRIEQGKKFNVFSKPFDFPFKAADAIYLSSDDEKYCFINAPEQISDELAELKQSNLLSANCSDMNNAIKVCFQEGSGCDIRVNYNMKYVEKNGDSAYFETDALMYGAIFADKDIYECQARRMMKRAEELASLYGKKEALIAPGGCDSGIDMGLFGDSLSSYADSADLSRLAGMANDMKDENYRALCKLW
jgi:hypothetical protein